MTDTDTETTVHRIRGVPGAGKTYTIKKMAREFYQEEGYDIDEMQWVSFTNSHVEDLQREFITDVFDDVNANIDEQISTLHSLVLDLLGIPTKDIISPSSDLEVYEKFFETYGMEYAHSPDPVLRLDRQDNTSVSDPEKILAKGQWLSLHGDQLEYSDVDLAQDEWLSSPPAETDYLPSEERRIIQLWRDFKDDEEYWEHHDYIVEYACREMEGLAAIPSANVLFVDEFQDYAPAEYAIIKRWITSEEFDHVVIAGDEFQSVYGFKGARPRFLTENLDPDHDRVLRDSRRCPPPVADVANDILPASGIQSYHDDGGNVREASNLDRQKVATLAQDLCDQHPPADDTRMPASDGPTDLADPTRVYLLTRTNSQMRKVAWALRKEGVPFSGIGTKFAPSYADDADKQPYPWHIKYIRIGDIVRQIIDGDPLLNYGHAHTLIQETEDSGERWRMSDGTHLGPPNNVSEGSSVTVWSAFPDCDDVRDILAQMSMQDWRQEMILHAAERDMSLTEAATGIKIGTIHAAKGRQAPATVVFSGYPHRLREKWFTDDEFEKEERRVYYTGVTRASESLVIARDFCSGEEVPCFSTGLPIDTTPTNLTTEV